jgi:hypothetical protein
MIILKNNMNKPKGRLNLKIYKNNKLIDIINGDNLIVDEGSDLLASRLHDNVSDDLVQLFSVGTGSGTPAAGDTRSTFTNIFTKSIESSIYSSVTQQLTYTFTLEAYEYNGNTIKEFGLLSNGPVSSEKLFARRVISGSIIKINDTRVEGTWIIQF